MPRIDDPSLQNVLRETAQQQQHQLQNSMQQSQQQLQSNFKDLLTELRDQPGADSKALDNLDRTLDERMGSLDRHIEELADGRIDPELAEEVDAALRGEADLDELASSLDEKTEQARESLAETEQRLEDTANDPRATDEEFLSHANECDTAREQLEGYEAARAATQTAQSMRQAEQELADIRDGIEQGLAAQAATAQIQAALEAIDLEDEERNARISQELTDGEVELD